MDTIEKIVIKGSDTTYILKDSNALPSANVTQNIDENSTAEQVPSAKSVYEMNGSGGGAAAGFGTPEASATQLESTQPPTATVEASGPNTAKIFKFSFGIPQGTKGDKGDTGAKGDPGEKGDTGATGAAGKDGITPTIGENGNWYLGDTDTGKPSRGATGAQGAQGPQGEFPVLPDGGSTTMSFYLMPVVLASTVELWGGSFVNPFTGAVVAMTYGFNNGSTVALYKTITADS